MALAVVMAKAKEAGLAVDMVKVKVVLLAEVT